MTNHDVQPRIYWLSEIANLLVVIAMLHVDIEPVVREQVNNMAVSFGLESIVLKFTLDAYATLYSSNTHGAQLTQEEVAASSCSSSCGAVRAL